MEAAQKRRCTCPDCPVPGGAVLSAYNTDPDGLCFQCRRAGRRPRVTALFEGTPAPGAEVVLWEVVAGLLLLQRNLRPGEPLRLQEALVALGIEVDREEVRDAVRSCRRRAMQIESPRGRAGYALLRWDFPFERLRRGGRLRGRTPSGA